MSDSMLLDMLGFVGDVLDTPGAMLRTGLVGENPLAAILDTKRRKSGRDVLEHYGLPGGDIGGFLAEMALDPTNLVGGGLAKSLLKRAGTIKKANALSKTQRAMGFMPEEVAKATKIVDDAGQPLKTYHGTPNAFDRYDMAKADSDALHGKGVYGTADPAMASTYTGADLKPGDPDLGWLTEQLNKQGRNPNVRMQYVDSRRPWDMELPVGKDELLRLAEREPPGTMGRSALSQWAHFEDPPLGKEVQNVLSGGTTDAARHLGYDSVVHEGGIQGGKNHKVVVALDPSQIYKPYIAAALRPTGQHKANALLAALLGHNIGRPLHSSYDPYGQPLDEEQQ